MGVDRSRVWVLNTCCSAVRHLSHLLQRETTGLDRERRAEGVGPRPTFFTLPCATHPPTRKGPEGPKSVRYGAPQMTFGYPACTHRLESEHLRI